MKFRERLKHWGPLLGRGYKATALIVFSTLVLFGLLNLICWWVLRPSRHTPSAAEFRRLPESFSKLYPELSEAQWSEFLKSADLSKFVFEPFTHFRNADQSSTYFN